jgi:hypothetical protein
MNLNTIFGIFLLDIPIHILMSVYRIPSNKFSYNYLSAVVKGNGNIRFILVYRLSLVREYLLLRHQASL